MSTESEPMLKISREDARDRVAREPERYLEFFQHGDCTVGLYAPRGDDPQTPHDQDELYVVSAGSGIFRRGETTVPFVTGDVLFVAAHVPHRFETFSDDFEAWVVFFGPKGGSKPRAAG